MSALNCYMYQDLVANYALQYIFASKQGPNRSVIDAAVTLIERDFGLLEAALSQSTWLSGSKFGFADVILAPAIATTKPFPEGGALLGKHPKLSGWLAAVADRPSAEFLYPPRP